MLFDAMYPKLMDTYAKHNEKFSGPNYRRSNPSRVKTSEAKTGVNILRLWCRHVIRQYNLGYRVISNVVPVNRATATNFQGALSTAPAHFAKLAYCGALVSRESNEDDAKVYQRWGRRPELNWRGSKKDFQFLINPEYIPVYLLNSFGIDVVALKNFDGETSPVELKLKAINESELSDNRQSLADNKAITETIINKELPQAASLRDNHKQEDGNTQRQESNPRDAQEAPAQRESNPFAEMRRRRRNRTQQADKRLEGKYAWIVDQDAVHSAAQMLMKEYENRLMKAMNKPFSPRVMEKGLAKAVELVAGLPRETRMHTVARWVETICHMEEWLTITGKFVLAPHLWFDLHQKANIIGAERNFLRKYEAKRHEWQDLRIMARYQEESQARKDIKHKDKTDWHNISFQVKQSLMLWHPEDVQLRKGSVRRWAEHIRLLNRRDRFSIDIICEVATWWLNAEDESAIFWRKEAGTGGIRSTRGFRKHFPQMLDQMRAEQARAAKEAKKGGRNDR